MDGHHPADLPPHLHAALAAVRPDARTGGHGVHCEASSPRAASRWRRVGFRDIGRPIPLPGTAAALVPRYLDADAVTGYLRRTRPAS
ncbi:hypothetical protein [Streptomyces sp. RFCAC02]|uniref:hypothetical protein n=1 Tax=Streptomyces sp. RFCAC02 TaxID=2499143 RepID=UPI00101EA888|nr:hypothetical protein [Streptomyces sp. RFCAC02]